MQRLGRMLCWGLCVLALHGNAAETGSLATLAEFLQQPYMAKGYFLQTVQLPAKLVEGKPVSKSSSGTYALSKPDKFRFEYLKPYKQSMGSDGRKLWVWDEDLAQLSVQTLPSREMGIPMALVLASNLDSLRRHFLVKDAGTDADGIQWLEVTPLARETPWALTRLGLRQVVAGPIDLAGLDVADALGQRTQIRLTPTDRRPIHSQEFSVPAKPTTAR